MKRIMLLLMLIIIVLGCAKQESINKEVNKMGLALTSSAFENNKDMPAKYTCQGEDINPPVEIHDLPEETKTLVLIVEDPDAPSGVWDHWVLFNIPPIAKIGENSVPDRAVQGKNSWGKNSYGGPCPPSGTHRYVFRLYALDTALDLGSGSGKADIEKAMQGHVLAQARLTGLYSKG